jgi:hypothetical protein
MSLSSAGEQQEQLLHQKMLGPATQEYKVYRNRFYILGSFMLTSLNQCLFWLTYSPITQESQAYYGISGATVNLLLNWGPIVYVLVILPVMTLAARPNGLRSCVLLAASLQCVTGCIRCIPSLFPGTFLESAGGNRDAGLFFIHTGQILNGVCGPLVMSTPTLLSQSWFPANERTTATASAVLANNFGSALGFLITPLLVRQNHPGDIPALLYTHAVIGLLGLALVMSYFPNAPPSPPSAAAARVLPSGSAAPATTAPATATVTAACSADDCQEPEDFSAREFLRGMLRAARDGNFMRLALGGGTIAGAFIAWNGVLNAILRPDGCAGALPGSPAAEVCYSDAASGWVAFASTIAAIVGGMAVGYVADHYMQKRFRVLLLGLLWCCVVSYSWFTLQLPSSLFPDTPHLLPGNEVTVIGAAILAGGFLGSTTPLFFELMVELTYPLPASISTGIMTFLQSISAAVFLVVPPSFVTSMNVVMTAAVGITLALVFFVREEYLRADASSSPTPPSTSTSTSEESEHEQGARL